MNDTRPLLHIEEVAKRLSISKSMAWKLVAEGEIRCIRIGRAIRISEAQLAEYLERSTEAWPR